MGNLHSSETHIYNNTDEAIYAVLKCAHSGTESGMMIGPNQLRNVPTTSQDGTHTLCVYEAAGDGVFFTNPTDTKVGITGRNFVVHRHKNNRIRIDTPIFGADLMVKEHRLRRRGYTQ
jgi:hypothetical protein